MMFWNEATKHNTAEQCVFGKNDTPSCLIIDLDADE